MKIAELLNSLKNTLNSGQQPSMTDSLASELENKPNIEPQQAETQDKTDKTTMVAPLQQKLELLKKAVDVDSYYGNNNKENKLTSPVQITLNIPNGSSDSNINLTINGQQVDELNQIKKIAGIPTATIFDAGDEEPLES